MIILYNPKNGVDIKGFIVEGKLMEPHLIDTLKQYEDATAEIMVDHYGFLKKVTPQEAQEILNKPKDLEYKCQYCDFATDTKIAFVGHNRKHKDEIAQAKEPVVDPDLIPVASSQELDLPKVVNHVSSQTEELPNGTDQDGVDWYGGGLQIERNI